MNTRTKTLFAIAATVTVAFNITACASHKYEPFTTQSASVGVGAAAVSDEPLFTRFEGPTGVSDELRSPREEADTEEAVVGSVDGALVEVIPTPQPQSLAEQARTATTPIAPVEGTVDEHGEEPKAVTQGDTQASPSRVAITQAPEVSDVVEPSVTETAVQSQVIYECVIGSESGFASVATASIEECDSYLANASAEEAVSITVVKLPSPSE